MWYDGSVFRLFESKGQPQRYGSAFLRYVLAWLDWLTPGATGVKDQVAVCAKDSSASTVGG